MLIAIEEYSYFRKYGKHNTDYMLMCADWQSGKSIEKLSAKYNLSKWRIKRITKAFQAYSDKYDFIQPRFQNMKYTTKNKTSSLSFVISANGTITGTAEGKKSSVVAKTETVNIENLFNELMFTIRRSRANDGAQLIDDYKSELTIKYDKNHTETMTGDIQYNGDFVQTIMEDFLTHYFGTGWKDLIKDKPTVTTKGDYIFCQVTFNDFSRLYTYKTTDSSIKQGDSVIVPVGPNNSRMIAKVERIIYCSKSNAPYPVDKTKTIIEKA